MACIDRSSSSLIDPKLKSQVYQRFRRQLLLCFSEAEKIILNVIYWHQSEDDLKGLNDVLYRRSTSLMKITFFGKQSRMPLILFFFFSLMLPVSQQLLPELKMKGFKHHLTAFAKARVKSDSFLASFIVVAQEIRTNKSGINGMKLLNYQLITPSENRH